MCTNKKSCYCRINFVESHEQMSNVLLDDLKELVCAAVL